MWEMIENFRKFDETENILETRLKSWKGLAIMGLAR